MGIFGAPLFLPATALNSLGERENEHILSLFTEVQWATIAHYRLRSLYWRCELSLQCKDKNSMLNTSSHLIFLTL